ncbi:hypothetical protein D3C87_1262340 [compost metagenome]
MENSEDRVAETLGLKGQKLVCGIRREVFIINRFLIPGVCVGRLTANGLHHFIVLVGNRIV